MDENEDQKSARVGEYLCVLAAVLAGAPAMAQPVLPEILQNGAASEVPVTVQNLLWVMLDQPFSSLTFRSMDRLFTTRNVPHSGQPWVLPQANEALDFSYEFDDYNTGRPHSSLGYATPAAFAADLKKQGAAALRRAGGYEVFEYS